MELIDNNSRRKFLKNSAKSAVGFYILPRNVLGGIGYIAPSDKLQVAAIGIEKNELLRYYIESNAKNIDISHLCDVNSDKKIICKTKFPKAKFYRDYREMLEKENKYFDAVSISSPDHTRAVIGLSAMQLGKHVLFRSPMAHDVHEVRTLYNSANYYKVNSCISYQELPDNSIQQLKAWYRMNLIGEIHTIICFTNKNQNALESPIDVPSKIPENMDWDLWLNTASYRSYSDYYVTNWHNLCDFGTGILGDTGFSLIKPVFEMLSLSNLMEIECCITYKGSDKFMSLGRMPISSHLIFTLEGSKKSQVQLHWMDGFTKPLLPNEMFETTINNTGNGILFIGTKGKMMYRMEDSYPKLSSQNTCILKGSTKLEISSSKSKISDWLDACFVGQSHIKNVELNSQFMGLATVTETILLGNLAKQSFKVLKANKIQKFNYPDDYIRLDWDAKNMRITNYDDANQFIKRDYRKGWS